MHARKKEQRSFVRLSVPGVPAYAKVSSVDAKMVNRKAGSGQEVDRDVEKSGQGEDVLVVLVVLVCVYVCVRVCVWTESRPHFMG